MAAFAYAPRFPLSAASSLFAPASSVTCRPRTSSLRAARRPTLLSSLHPTPHATLEPESASPPPARDSGAPASPSVPTAAAIADLSQPDRERVDIVRQQLEFWFTATNLRRDWYLRRQMDDDGWLDPSVFLLFNRIKRLNATLEDVILAAHMSEELEVSAPSPASFGDALAQTRVRRSSTLPDFRDWDEDEVDRSFILKHFPADATVDSLTALFTEIAPVAYLRIYRSKDGVQQQRALVCFADKSTADSVFASFATTAPAEAAGIVLRRRRTEPGVAPLQAVAGDPSRSYARPSSSPLNPRADSVVFRLDGLPAHLDWKALFDHVTNVVTSHTETAPRFVLYTPGNPTAHVTVPDSLAIREMLAKFTDDGFPVGETTAAVLQLEDPEEIAAYWEYATQVEVERRRRRAQRLATPVEAGDNARPSGVVVKLTGLPSEATWQTIKADLAAFGKIVYLNHKSGEDSCLIRFGSPQSAQDVVAAITAESDPVRVAGYRVDAALLEGEEQEEYWARARVVGRSRRHRLDDPVDEEEPVE